MSSLLARSAWCHKRKKGKAFIYHYRPLKVVPELQEGSQLLQAFCYEFSTDTALCHQLLIEISFLQTVIKPSVDSTSHPSLLSHESHFSYFLFPQRDIVTVTWLEHITANFANDNWSLSYICYCSLGDNPIVDERGLPLPVHPPLLGSNAKLVMLYEMDLQPILVTGKKFLMVAYIL